jgi:hypothetical protein
MFVMGYQAKPDPTMHQLKRQARARKIFSVVIIAIIVLIPLMAIFNPFRFDTAGGSHRITPTAMDTNIWGHWMVYYRTTDFTKSSEEEFYFIHKDNTDIVEQIQDAIIYGDEIVVYYDRYIGYKGWTAPDTSPITRIEIIK